MLLADGNTLYRGVQVMFLPQEADAAHGHSEAAIHLPDGVTTDSTPILRLISNGTTIPYDLIFSVAVFGVPFNQATL